MVIATWTGPGEVPVNAGIFFIPDFPEAGVHLFLTPGWEPRGKTGIDNLTGVVKYGIIRVYKLGEKYYMAKTITLKFPGVCADEQCKSLLKVGDKGRWYGRGRVYGMECHGPARANAVAIADNPEAVLVAQERAEFEKQYAMGVEAANQMQWLNNNMGQEAAMQYEHDLYWKHGIE